jgi:general secretion pathway protein H
VEPLEAAHGERRIVNGESEIGRGDCVNASCLSARVALVKRSANAARCTRRDSTACGFTLVEVLVVLLIMGLVVGMVSAVVRPDERSLLRVEAERLARLLDLAAAESRYTAKSIGWTAAATGYRFWRFRDDTGWLEIRDSDVLRARTLPPGMTISDLRIDTVRRRDGMRLEFYPAGPLYAFTIEMSLGTERYTVAASPVGIVRAVPGGGKPNGEIALR